MLILFGIIFTLATFIKCENRRNGEHYEGRQGRLFAFNVVEEDIRIDLDFTIPFIKIPVKKTINSVYGWSEFPTININPASLALGGVIVLGTTVVVPFLLKNYAHQQDNYRYSRLIDNAEFNADGMLGFAQQIFTNTDGLRGCPLRVACWAAQKEIMDPRAILNGIINNKILSTMVNSSAVEEAMISGIHGRTCSRYGPCPLQEHHISMISNNLALLINHQDL